MKFLIYKNKYQKKVSINKKKWLVFSSNNMSGHNRKGNIIKKEMKKGMEWGGY